MNNELLAVFEYHGAGAQAGPRDPRRTGGVFVAGGGPKKHRPRPGPARRRSTARRWTSRPSPASRSWISCATATRKSRVGEAQAKYPGKNYKLGDLIEIEVTPRNFGRIAAQTAKQAIIQKLRMAEKDKVFAAYKDHVGDIVTGTVRRFDRSDVIVDLGDAEAIMPSKERVPSEEYQIGDRIRFLLLNLDSLTQGTQLILSRANPDFIKKLFELEVSEIADGTVEIKGIAREAGFRTKIAVHSNDEKVDPVGACVGMRGQRVKNIVRELSGEKVDIVRWSTDVKTFVTNSLAPAKLLRLEINELENAVQGHRRGRPALAGDRQEGPERPPDRQADRLEGRHPEGRERHHLRRTDRARHRPVGGHRRHRSRATPRRSSPPDSSPSRASWRRTSRIWWMSKASTPTSPEQVRAAAEAAFESENGKAAEEP